MPPSAVIAIYEDEAVNHLFKEKATVALFPNPASEQLGIKWNNKLNTISSTISTSDISGKEIWRSEVLSPATNEIQIDIKEFNSGFYVITFRLGLYMEYSG